MDTHATNKLLLIGVLVSAFLASSCAPQYIKPENGQIARIRFVTTQDIGVNATLLVLEKNYKTCDTKSRIAYFGTVKPIGIDRNEEPIEPAIPKDPSFNYSTKNNHETTIRADSPTSITMFGTQGASQCAVSFSITPKPGANYEVMYYYDWRALRCNISVDEITQTPAFSRKPDPTVEHESQCRN